MTEPEERDGPLQQSRQSRATQSLLDELPPLHRFDLWLVPHWTDDSQPRFAPEFAGLWARSDLGRITGLTAEEVIAEISHSGRAPEWIDLCVVDEDGHYTYLEARFSRTLANSFAPPLGPFQVRGPYLPHSFATFTPQSNRAPIPLKFSLHDVECGWCNRPRRRQDTGRARRFRGCGGW